MYHLLPLSQKENLLLCYFLTAFLKRKSCEPPSCVTSAQLIVDGTETGHRRQFAHTMGLLIYLLHKNHVHFPARQPLTGESCPGTEMLYILGLVLRALFQSVKGHEHNVSWCKYSVKPSIYYIKNTITAIEEHNEHRYYFPCLLRRRILAKVSE
mgnify:CR=1 FL=1